MKDGHRKNIKRNKIFMFIGLALIIVSPIVTDVNLFYFPFENLYLNFLGLIFFEGLELATLTFFCGFLIISCQFLFYMFNTEVLDKKQFEEFRNDSNILLDENIEKNELSEDVKYGEQTLKKSFEEVDDLINQLDSVLKKSRHDVFNLMLDPNGINSPDDFQSAVESLELALSSLRAIHKQIIEIKKIT